MMERRAGSLVRELVKQQKLMGLTDENFAKELGISRQLWAGTRDGDAAIGMSLLSGVVRKFPGLGGEVLAEIRAYRAADREVAAVGVNA